MRTFDWKPEYVGDVLPLAKGFHYINMLNAQQQGADGAPCGYNVESILAAASAA